jgi:PPM family protein phosphatase
VIVHRIRPCGLAALTHRGAVRKRNEDMIAVDRNLLAGDMDKPSVHRLAGVQHVLMIADGMGGHAQGALASRTALEMLRETPDALSNERTCKDTLGAANDRIYDEMNVRPGTAGMGTTIVGVALGLGIIVHFNVGDSRAYRHKRGRLVRLSHDDVPASPTHESPLRTTHLITQSLGGRLTRTLISPHVGVGPPLARGETILLCSDGLTDMVEDGEIVRVLDTEPDPAASVWDLFARALRAGGRDNVSIVVVRAF